MVIWFFLATILAAWLVFGTIQDIRKREIANWITLSLLGIGIFVRLIYSIEVGKWDFLLYGLFSLAIFVFFGYALYYSKVFAGGDAKLLMGVGAFIPGKSFLEVFLNGLTSILFLLLIGAVYSIAASFWISIKNKEIFYAEIIKFKKYYFYSIPLSALICVSSLFLQDILFKIGIFMISASLLLYPYFKAVDKCMIRIYDYKSLTPGDWLERDIRVGGKTIKSTVHGLSEKDIALLKKYKKKVLIKEGIPFVPVFLLTYILMVFFFLFEWQLVGLLV